MNPSQKFEEMEDALSLAMTWLNEVDHPDPWVDAAYDLLQSFRNMIRGDKDWKTCLEVMERIEKMHPEVDE
ncbi:MAG: hypothetical protein RSD95_03760 [Clostridia bacterium]